MFGQLINRLIGYSNRIVILIVAMAMAFFLYGLVGYILNSDSEDKRRESVSYIVGGIIGLFVMVSVWGILSMLSGSFNFSFGIPQFTF